MGWKYVKPYLYSLLHDGSNKYEKNLIFTDLYLFSFELNDHSSARYRRAKVLGASFALDRKSVTFSVRFFIYQLHTDDIIKKEKFRFFHNFFLVFNALRITKKKCYRTSLEREKIFREFSKEESVNAVM